MNPMTNTKNIKKLSEQELNTNFKTSWHDQYRDSAWIFVGGLPYDLTEGDIICVFSQYGEIVNLNLIRDKITGKQKGFCFICYEDQRSTILAVDNFNGIKILNRTIRVDHVADYKVPKDHKDMDAETRKIQDEGCAPNVAGHGKKAQLPVKEPSQIKNDPDDPISDVIRLPERLPIGIKTEIKDEKTSSEKAQKKKSRKEKKNKKKKKKHQRKSSSNDSSAESDSSSNESDSEDDRKRKTSKYRSHDSDSRTSSKKYFDSNEVKNYSKHYEKNEDRSSDKRYFDTSDLKKSDKDDKIPIKKKKNVFKSIFK